MEDLKENGLKIYNAIFDGSKTVDIDGVEYRLLSFSSGIKYLDLFGYRFIEQNRMKPSEWGKKQERATRSCGLSGEGNTLRESWTENIRS